MFFALLLDQFFDVVCLPIAFVNKKCWWQKKINHKKEWIIPACPCTSSHSIFSHLWLISSGLTYSDNEYRCILKPEKCSTVLWAILGIRCEPTCSRKHHGIVLISDGPFSIIEISQTTFFTFSYSRKLIHSLTITYRNN